MLESNSKHWFTTSFLPLEEGAGKRCSECGAECGGKVRPRDGLLKVQKTCHRGTAGFFRLSAIVAMVKPLRAHLEMRRSTSVHIYK